MATVKLTALRLAMAALLPGLLSCAEQPVTSTAALAQPFTAVPLATPVPGDALGQRLTVLPDGNLAVYWWQDHGPGLSMSVLSNGHWSAPKPVAASGKLADARIVPVGGTALAALWLVSVPLTIGGGEVQELYAAYGDPTGDRWTPPMPIDRRGPPSNKESPVLAALADGSLLAAWIALPVTRAGAQDAATTAIATARIGQDGVSVLGRPVDSEFCTCCNLALAADGQVGLLAYRDLRGDNLRDPAIARITPGGASTAKLVHDDHWRIDGCPASGPALDRLGATVAVAWLTEVDGRYVARVAFSNNRGLDFAAPWQVAADIAGLVGIVLDGADSALIAWTSFGIAGEAVHLARIHGDGRVERPSKVLELGGGKAFKWPGPRMAKTKDALFIAWQEQQANKPGLLQVRVAE